MASASTASAPWSPNAASSTLCDHVKSMFGNDELTDLEIRLRNGKIIRVHKFVVFQCKFFRLACTSSFQEAQDNLVTFPEDDPLAIVYVLGHLYGYFPESIELPSSIFGKVGVSTFDYCNGLLNTFLLARKFVLPNLKTVAASNFRDRVMAMLWILQDIPGDCAALRRVYEEEELAVFRRYIVHAVSANRHNYKKDPEAFSALLDQLPGLARDLATIEITGQMPE